MAWFELSCLRGENALMWYTIFLTNDGMAVKACTVSKDGGYRSERIDSWFRAFVWLEKAEDILRVSESAECDVVVSRNPPEVTIFDGPMFTPVEAPRLSEVRP